MSNAAATPETEAITPADQARLIAWGIPLDVAAAAGVRSVTSAADLPEALAWCGDQTPGILFHHRSDGDRVPQFRPDSPADPQTKYLQPKGSGSALSLHPWMADRLTAGTPYRLLPVEGTKQALAAVAVVPDDVVVVGMQGCQSWMHDGVALPALTTLVAGATAVIVALDADRMTNRDVWEAGELLASHCAAVGCGSIRFVALPAGKKAGLDDWLAALPVADRPAAMARLIDGATAPGGRRPARKKQRPDNEPATSRAVAAQVRWDDELIADPDREIKRDDGSVMVIPGQIWMEAAARIIRTITVIDDLRSDATQEVVHDVEVVSGGRRAVVRGVADSDLSHPERLLRQVPGGWGTRVARAPLGRLTGETIEAAIRAEAAQEPPTVRTALKRTGWADVDGQPVWVHAGGAIGPDGHTDAVAAQLDAPYRPINLPDPAAHADTLAADVAASLAVRAELSDPTVWIALIGAMALAAAGVKPSMLLFVVGPHGSGKTWIVATACSHLSPAYAPKGALMVSFDATTGVIGDAGRGVHHCLLWVDDFRKRDSERARQAQGDGLDRLTRRSYAGGAAGRSRNQYLSESGRTETILPDMASPLVVVTGEETPRATDVGSSVERMLSIAVTDTTMLKGAADRMAALARSGAPQRAWAGFLRWMAGQIAALDADPTLALTTPSRISPVTESRWPCGQSARP